MADYRRLPVPVRHGFTHFELSLDVFAAIVGDDVEAPAVCRFVAAEDLVSEAFPSLMRKVLAAVGESTV
jgi:A/G-specific adenine glycosylase